MSRDRAVRPHIHRHTRRVEFPITSCGVSKRGVIVRETGSHAFAVLALCVAMTVRAPCQNFTTLTTFDNSNGAFPFYMSPVQGPDGNLYGTTFQGGAFGEGEVFRIAPDGAVSTFFNFARPGSAFPVAGLVLGIDGNFYGTTANGGTNNYGTVFKLTPTGTLSSLYDFCSQPGCTDGMNPYAPLVQATDGNFYGSTLRGGKAGCANEGCGTIFRITPGGALTTLYSFPTCQDGNCPDGSSPIGGLVQAIDGNLYGTTNGFYGGDGTIFRIALTGALTTVHNFNGTDGFNPYAGLIQGTDGNLYGTTFGTQGFFGGFGGTIFRATLGGAVTAYSFGSSTQGNPAAPLVQGTDGNFYGTTMSYESGSSEGTIFQITPTGILTTLHTFDVGDGAGPTGGLLQATNGKFYGTTNIGGDIGCNGTTGCGTVFSLDVGLGPFVSLVRNPTKAGQMFGILGQGLTGSTNVSLNGNPVPFTIKSDTLITATIPAGGTTGPVTVTTPTGTLTSNVPFRVLPQLLSFTPTSGPVGTQVTITGVSLTQTTGVGFGDYTPAQFTVNSDTQVTATVPTSAKTGPVGIQTQGGIAISTQTFTVTQ